MPRSTLPRFAALLVFSFTGLTVALRAQPTDVYTSTNSGPNVSLNGSWQFRYAAGPRPAGEDFVAASFDDRTWSPINVPGHWELQGFAEPVYGTQELPAGTGFYRRSFRIPADWSGQRVFLRFDGVLYGFDAWVNGQPIGSWASGYNPATFDVTDLLQPGKDNVLAVRVSTRSHGWEFDTNDCWALSGIYRDVTLFALPAAHLEQFTTQTKLKADGSATLTVSTRTSAADIRVSGRLLAPDGGAAAELTFASNKATLAQAEVTIRNPSLWTAETPALYTLELTLSSGQRITEKIGLREVGIVDGVLQLNGRPIKLRGVDHHDLWPDTGRATDEAKIRRDLELIKAANCNFVRTSHYPPHPRLLTLCDELGLYVMDEVPFGFGEKHLKDPAYQENLLTRAHATVARDRNRPSVIIWSVGNENENTPLTFATARRVKELDPTRPVCFPQIGSYFGKTWQEIPEDIDVYAPHYPSLATVKEYAHLLKRPVIFTEYAHALGLATDQVQAQWDVIQASPRLAGGAIWMFQDQGILRAAKAGETPATSHRLGLAVWPDAQHYYDTYGNQGMDGLVYSDRQPQVDYWQVRKVYSPVQIAATDTAVKSGKNQLSLAVENRFDFRTLDGVTLHWTLQRNGKDLDGGKVSLRAAARTTETIPVIFNLPTDTATDVFTLALSCTDKAAPSFYERILRLQLPNPEQNLAAVTASGQAKAALKVDASPTTILVGHPSFTVILDRASGEITVSDPSGAKLAGGFFRTLEGGSPKAKPSA